MNDSDLELDWLDLGTQLLPRSKLFCLTPIGIGTERVEGLTSYLVRLAKAHSVSPKRLIRMVFPSVQPEVGEVLEVGSFFSWGAKSINGLGPYASLFCRAATSLTCARELHFLTLLPLQRLLPENSKGLLVRHPQWCSACLAEMAASGQESIRPLAWSFRLYRYCSIHRHSLIDRCPVCGNLQHFIPGYPSLDHCSHCQAWLGTKEGKTRSEPPSAEQWASLAIEDIVANLPGLEVTATREGFLQALSTAIQTCAGGSRPRFCREINLEVTALRAWFQRRRPSFPQWLAVSYGLDILPSQLFLEDAGLANGCRLRERPATLKLFGQRPHLSKGKQMQLKNELGRIAADPDDVSSLAAVARGLHLDMGTLKHWAPEHCARIRDKHAEAMSMRGVKRRAEDLQKVKAAVRALIEKGEYPRAEKVNQALRKQGRSLIQPELRKAYREAIFEFRRERES